MILILFSFFADSTNLKLIEALPYDMPWAIDINGNYMYTCGGNYAEFYNVYSLDNPYNPRIISHWDKDVKRNKSEFENSRLLHYNGRLYKWNEIMNVEDPYNIFKEGNLDADLIYMQIKDTILFSNVWCETFINIYSLSDPSSPLLLTSYEPESLNTYEPGFIVFDTLCFITDEKSFEVINIKDPENPYFVSFNKSVIKNSNTYYRDIIKGKDNYIYLFISYENDTLLKYYPSVETLYTIDCSNVDSVIVVDKDFIGELNYDYQHLMDCTIMDTSLYILSSATYYYTPYIYSYSLKNPDNPSLINKYHGGFDDLVSFDHSDSLLYVCMRYSGINILNSSLKYCGYSSFSGDMKRAIQRNNLIYTGSYGSGIRIFRETPDTIHELTIGGQPYDVTDIALFDTLLYASSRCNGFYIFSITDSSNPILLYQDSTLPDSFMSNYIAVDSNYIYISGYLGEDPLCILDRYDYSIVSITDSVGGKTFIRDTIGFIGDKILNLSDKTDPSIITNLSGDANALKDSLLLLTGGYLYSVARLDSPILLDILDDGIGEFRGDSIYIIDQWAWDPYIKVYDVSKPDSAYCVAKGFFSIYRDGIEYAYPTVNRKILTDKCFYIGFIEQGGVEEESQEDIPSKIAVDYIHFNYKDKYSVSLYDITGRKILNKDLEGEGRVYVKDLSPGAYFISIPEKNLWEKIIIIH